MADSLSMIRWKKHIDIVKAYLTDDKRTFKPKVVKQFGEKNFKIKDNIVYLNNKEIVADDDRKRSIIEKEEQKYGGQVKPYERLSRRYIGISRRDVQKIYAGSERRQLKARHQKQKKGSNFIRAPRPGHVEIDLTFYKGQKYPVFGAIDVFSRYCFYQRVPDKRADSILVVMKAFKKKFESVSKFKLYKVSTDSGSEFQKSFADFLDKQKEPKIFYDRQVKSRKLIENLNASLRHYIERVGWDTVKDLDDLIQDFVKTYNETKHSTTKRVPNDLINVDPKTIIDDRKNDGKSGFAMAKLEPGDKVRLYDPRRVDIKEEMKERLKGKIKLTSDDYVKKFTSFHRGQDPHWTKKTYTIKAVHIGKKRANRYLLKEKTGFFFRDELQKVAPITKPDPRKKVLAKRKEIEEKIKKALPEPFRAAKYLRKELIAHYENDEKPELEDPATVLEIYRNHLIVLHDSGYISWLAPKEIVQLTGKTHTKTDIQKWIKLNEPQIITARSEIDEKIQEIKDKMSKG